MQTFLISVKILYGILSTQIQHVGEPSPCPCLLLLSMSTTNWSVVYLLSSFILFVICWIHLGILIYRNRQRLDQLSNSLPNPIPRGHCYWQILMVIYQTTNKNIFIGWCQFNLLLFFVLQLLSILCQMLYLHSCVLIDFWIVSSPWNYNDCIVSIALNYMSRWS